MGLYIKQQRLKNKKTQRQIAFAMGVNTQYISAIENGRKNITLKKLDQLFIALDISAAKFFKTNK